MAKWEAGAISLVERLLAEAGVPATVESGASPARPDWIVTVGEGRKRQVIAVEAKATGEPRRVLEVIGRREIQRASLPGAHWVLVAREMGPRAVELCRQAGIGYVDETGNAWLKIPGMVMIERKAEIRGGKSGRKLRGLFGSRSSRIIRVMLCRPEARWTQAALAGESGTSVGLVNLVVKRLVERAYGTQEEPGGVTLTDPGNLLRAWARARRPEKAIPCRSMQSPDQVEEQIDKASGRVDAQYALTYLSGAKYRAPFVQSDQVHAFVLGDHGALIRESGLKPVASGGNIILLLPKDDGVFYGVGREQGRNVVSDVQLFVDLYKGSDRAREQAEFLATSRIPFLGQAKRAEVEAGFHRFLAAAGEGDEKRGRSDAAGAASSYAYALDQLVGLPKPENRLNVESVRIRLWLSWLETAFGSKDPTALVRAEEIYRTEPAALGAQEIAGYAEGWIWYGLALMSALRAAWRPEVRSREAAQFGYYYTLATSPHMNASREVAPRAAAVREWLEGQGIRPNG